MPNQHTGEQYSKEDCIEALREAADVLGHSPKMKEYRSMEIRPGTWTIVDRFGSWNEAKDAAGLEKHFERSGPPEILDISEDDWWELSRSQRYSLKNRAKIAKYKIDRGCSICGYDDHPLALDFHHTDGDKEFNIGHHSHAKNFDKLEEEMDKCDVVCTNCHRELESKYDWC